MADDSALNPSPSSGGTATPGDAPCSPPPNSLAGRSLVAALAALGICLGGYLFATGGGIGSGASDPTASPPPDATQSAPQIAIEPTATPPVTATAVGAAPERATADLHERPTEPPPRPSETPSPRPAPVAHPPRPADTRPAPVRLREAVATVSKTLSCGALDVTEGKGAPLAVTGVVATDTDVKKVRGAIDALEITPPPSSDGIMVEPQPFCGALVALGGAAPKGAGGAPTLTLNRADGIYPNGEAFQVTATPTAGGGHLTVDYLDQVGPVVHMIPTPLRPDGALPGGGAVTLGADPATAGPKDRFYTVSPPFGRAMVLAIVTDQPLFDQPRPEQEEAQAYVKALTAAIAKAVAAGRSVRVATVFFETTER